MMKPKKILTTVLLLCSWLLTGCAAVIVGAGAGAGAYTYIEGELKRSYEVKFDTALSACIGILEDLGQPIIEKTTDGEKTTVLTARKDGSPQTIMVAIESIEWTQVSVRTGRIGYWKREVSQQFHEFFEERIKE
ncbi:MAG: DUF3568 family protein [Deltaproteobacteria bacterium]|jgi:predicted small secreted protein|nr:DUF3568 family protein [Deltaproteobacteria bacterium]